MDEVILTEIIEKMEETIREQQEIIDRLKRELQPESNLTYLEKLKATLDQA